MELFILMIFFILCLVYLWNDEPTKIITESECKSKSNKKVCDNNLPLRIVK